MPVVNKKQLVIEQPTSSADGTLLARKETKDKHRSNTIDDNAVQHITNTTWTMAERQTCQKRTITDTRIHPQICTHTQTHTHYILYFRLQTLRTDIFCSNFDWTMDILPNSHGSNKKLHISHKPRHIYR